MSWSRTDRRGALRLGLLGVVGGGLGGLLAACSFRPLYGRREATQRSTVDDLSLVRVNPLQDRTGQILHNLLRNRFNPNGQPVQPAYVLEVTLRESVRELALRSDETATRADLDLVAEFTLRRPSAEDVLFRGHGRSINSYNIRTSQFATHVSEQDARERGLRELADDIRAQVAIYFARASGG